ncbi:MAG: hypothetical protein ACFE9T_00305 [Promethearchaeota archaeon]
MDFFKKNLEETLEAINNYIEKNINVVSVKHIRTYYGIKSSNRSKINFIWRSLDYLTSQGVLRVNGATNPKKYIIEPQKKIDIKQFLIHRKNNR